MVQHLTIPEFFIGSLKAQRKLYSARRMPLAIEYARLYKGATQHISSARTIFMKEADNSVRTVNVVINEYARKMLIIKIEDDFMNMCVEEGMRTHNAISLDTLNKAVGSDSEVVTLWMQTELYIENMESKPLADMDIKSVRLTYDALSEKLTAEEQDAENEHKRNLTKEFEDEVGLYKNGVQSLYGYGDDIYD